SGEANDGVSTRPHIVQGDAHTPLREPCAEHQSTSGVMYVHCCTGHVGSEQLQMILLNADLKSTRSTALTGSFYRLGGIHADHHRVRLHTAKRVGDVVHVVTGKQTRAGERGIPIRPLYRPWSIPCNDVDG